MTAPNAITNLGQGIYIINGATVNIKLSTLNNLINCKEEDYVPYAASTIVGVCTHQCQYPLWIDNGKPYILPYCPTCKHHIYEIQPPPAAGSSTPVTIGATAIP